MKLPLLRQRSEPQEVAPARPGGLGTFAGVFTPSILTILGVIMYLRFGWVVGQVGLLGTTLIVTLSTLITFLTCLSISAIATDQRVRVGGAYYMISRSLGIEAGGAIGIPLYLAQGLSVALYTVGFAESVVAVVPVLDQRLVGIVTTVFVAVLALVSAQVAIRAQYFIMVAIGLSLASFALGSSVSADPAAAAASASASVGSPGFWRVFAVFFPAVTGIMAGVNMSGDLANPARSIPRGTLAAVGVGYVIYMAIPFLLSSRADAAQLIADPLIMRRMALWGDAILLGVWGATLSSAVGSILGAPRVLQALARDGVLPRWLRWLGRGSGEGDEPRAGTIFTLAVALLAVSLGNLDVIAPVLTMFFLATYAMLNLVAGVERFLGSPSFRPRLKVHWSLSLLGAVGCLGVMVLINAAATAIAVALVAITFLWLERREMRSAWGDVRRGIWLAMTRAGLLRLQDEEDPKNWRPHLLVLSGAPTSRWELIELAVSLTHNRSLLTVATVLPESVPSPRKREMQRAVREYLERRGVDALARVVGGSDAYQGAEELVESYGFGALTPNTILLGETKEMVNVARYCAMIERFHHSEKNVLILYDPEDRGFGDRSTVDVWWGGLKGNGGLMLVLAHLLGSSLEWKGCVVRLRIVVQNSEGSEEARRNLDAIVGRIRTDVAPEVVVQEGRAFDEIVREASGEASLVFMGVAEPGPGFVEYYGRMASRAEGLPPVVFTLAAHGIEFRKVLL